ncbi:MAG: hypothetical protein ACTSV1_05150 [Alphaproteobacteria bacterium]
MSLIPRTAPPTVPTSVTQSRSPAGPRQLSGSDLSPIEETSPQGGIDFANSHVFKDEQAGDNRRQDRPRNRNLVEYSGSSQTFASIFEEVNQGGTPEDVKRGKNKSFAGLLARAINVYEATSRTIHGQNETRGTTVSLNL